MKGYYHCKYFVRKIKKGSASFPYIDSAGVESSMHGDADQFFFPFLALTE